MIVKLLLLSFLFWAPDYAAAEEFTKEEMDKIKFESHKNMPQRVNASAEEKAQFIVRTFEPTCFIRFFDPDRIVEYANTFFTPITSEAEADQFRYNVQSEAGRVWWGHFPEGQIAIVLDEDPVRCHTLGYEGDKEAFHSDFKAMRDRAAKGIKNAELTYSFKEIPEQGLNKSSIEITFNDDRPYKILAYGSTPIEEIDGPQFMATIQAIPK